MGVGGLDRARFGTCPGRTGHLPPFREEPEQAGKTLLSLLPLQASGPASGRPPPKRRHSVISCQWLACTSVSLLLPPSPNTTLCPSPPLHWAVGGMLTWYSFYSGGLGGRAHPSHLPRSSLSPSLHLCSAFAFASLLSPLFASRAHFLTLPSLPTFSLPSSPPREKGKGRKLEDLTKLYMPLQHGWGGLTFLGLFSE